MKQLCLWFALVALLSLVIPMSAQNIPHLEAGQYFSVSIEQDGTLAPSQNHQVVLKKQPFTIVLYLKQPDGILINASLSSQSFDCARAGQPLQEIPGFADLGMAEDIFNPQAMLMLSANAPHYWYYENAANHRFNEAAKQEGILVCKRIVANVLDREASRQFVSIKEIPGNTLYLVFMKTDWTSDFSQQIERQREYLKIIFR